jgi:hypothetical protein
MKTAGLLAILLLSGCSAFSGSSSDAKAAPGTILRQCQDIAEADPAITKYAAENVGANNGLNTYADLVDTGRKNSIDRCILQHGAVPRGGVERVKG